MDTNWIVLIPNHFLQVLADLWKEWKEMLRGPRTLIMLRLFHLGHNNISHASGLRARKMLLRCGVALTSSAEDRQRAADTACKIYVTVHTQYTLHSTLYIPHSALYTPHSTLDILDFTLNTPRFIPHTSHTTRFTLHILHFKFPTLHSTFHCLHFTFCARSHLCVSTSYQYHTCEHSGSWAASCCWYDLMSFLPLVTCKTQNAVRSCTRKVQYLSLKFSNDPAVQNVILRCSAAKIAFETAAGEISTWCVTHRHACLCTSLCRCFCHCLQNPSQFCLNYFAKDYEAALLVA